MNVFFWRTGQRNVRIILQNDERTDSFLTQTETFEKCVDLSWDVVTCHDVERGPMCMPFPRMN